MESRGVGRSFLKTIFFERVPDNGQRESETNRLDEAVRAHEILTAKTSIAIHHGTFQLADDGIDTPQKQLRPTLCEHQTAPANTEGTAMQIRKG